jgi:hypothetical protein
MEKVAAKQAAEAAAALRASRLSLLKQVFSTIILFTSYVVISVAVLMELERDEPIGANRIAATYFTFVTVATVGYGDIYPTNDFTRLWVCFFMITIGMTCVFAPVVHVISQLTAPLTDFLRRMLDRAFPPTGVDLDATGDIDFHKPRHWIIYYFKNLLPSFALNLIIQCSCAAVFHAIDPTLSWARWLYHCFITATTIGYGDTPITTDAGRMWACFHIILSVAMVGELVASIDTLRTEREEIVERNNMFTTVLTRTMLEELFENGIALRNVYKDVDTEEEINAHKAYGLNESEFALAMMIEMDVIKLEHATPFIKQFRMLDADGSGRLNYKDLEQTEGKSLVDIQIEAAKRRAAMGMTGMPLKSSRNLLVAAGFTPASGVRTSASDEGANEGTKASATAPGMPQLKLPQDSPSKGADDMYYQQRLAPLPEEVYKRALPALPAIGSMPTVTAENGPGMTYLKDVLHDQGRMIESLQHQIAQLQGSTMPPQYAPQYAPQYVPQYAPQYAPQVSLPVWPGSLVPRSHSARVAPIPATPVAYTEMYPPYTERRTR